MVPIQHLLKSTHEAAIGTSARGRDQIRDSVVVGSVPDQAFRGEIRFAQETLTRPPNCNSARFMGYCPRSLNREAESSGHRPSPSLPGFFLVWTIKRRIDLARIERLRVTLQVASAGGEKGSGLSWNTPSCTSDSKRLPRKDVTFFNRNVACAKFRHFYG